MPTVLGTDDFNHGNFTSPGGGPYTFVAGTPERDTTAPLAPGAPCSLLIATTTNEELVYDEVAGTRGWCGFYFLQRADEEVANVLVMRMYTSAWSSTSAGDLFYRTTNALRTSLNVGIAGTDSSITLDAWHWVEMIYNVGGTTYTLDAQIDGVDLTQVTEGSHSADVVQYFAIKSDSTGRHRIALMHYGSATSSSDWMGEPVIPAVGVPVAWMGV